jgi:hypothetical protein
MVFGPKMRDLVSVGLTLAPQPLLIHKIAKPAGLSYSQDLFSGRLQGERLVAVPWLWILGR